MALAWGGAPLLGNNGAGGSRAPEFEGGGGRRAGGGDCGEGGGGDGAEGATTCFWEVTKMNDLRIRGNGENVNENCVLIIISFVRMRRTSITSPSPPGHCRHC